MYILEIQVLNIKRTFISGSYAAVAGGYTTCLCMGNTNPAADNTTTIRYMIDKAEKIGLIDLLPYGCVTINRAGEHIVEMGDMLNAGAIAFQMMGARL